MTDYTDLKKRLIAAQDAASFGPYVERMAAGGELGAATRAIFDALDAEKKRADDAEARASKSRDVSLAYAESERERWEADRRRDGT